MKTFALPDLGEGLLEAELVAWHVGVGDHVVADQPLLSVETDKAVVEVPSPQAGRIARLCAAPGDRVKVGAPLVEFEEGAHPDTGAVVGTLAAPEPARPPSARSAAASTTGGPKASPAVRTRARELGIDLSTVPPSGPDGTVTLADLEATTGTTIAGEALKGMRRAMALNMRRSGNEVVPATVSDDADIGAWSPTEDITVRLIRATVAGCRAAPALNAWYDGGRLQRRLHETVDLGLAVDTPEGLIVPVLRDAGRRSAGELRQTVETLRRDAHSRRIPLAELRGQTITLSNFGMFAGRYAALAIVPPQVAILGAGRARAAVLPTDGQIVVRRILPLSLTFDHRAATGGDAARFLQAVIADLERAD